MTQTNNPLDNLSSAFSGTIQAKPQAETIDFSIFEEGAWAPYKNWDSDPLARVSFTESLFALGNSKSEKELNHEYRAAMLIRFSRSLLDRLGCHDLELTYDKEVEYEYSEGSSSQLRLPYTGSLMGETPTQQFNGWVGLLVRSAGEHLANRPNSAVRKFLSEVQQDFAKYRTPELGDYVGQSASVAVIDRAIAAQIAEEYPGFSKMALDGLYQLQAENATKYFEATTKALKSGKLPDGNPATQEQLIRMELEMASQFYQAETTAPGNTWIDSIEFPWALDIERAATMLRNVKDLDADYPYAARATESYASVVKRILNMPEKPPAPPESSGDKGDGKGGEKLPDLGALAEHYQETAAKTKASEKAKKPKSAPENAGSDIEVEFDQQKFQKLLDSDAESCHEETPWAQGQDTADYFFLRAKAGPTAAARYRAVRAAYGPEIRRLRTIIQDAYQIRSSTQRCLRSGRPDSARLTKIRFGSQEVFKRDQIQTDGEPIDFVILVDESGSMNASTNTKGYKEIPSFARGTRSGYAEMAGTDADNNRNADFTGGSRADIARVFSIMLNQAVQGLPGINAYTFGYTTGSPFDYGLTSDRYGQCMVRELATPGSPNGAALSLASGGNADKEALVHALKVLKDKGDPSHRKAIVYLADGGVSDPRLEELLKNAQKRLPIMFIDMSDSRRGTGGSLKIKHHYPVNSIPQAVRAAGAFFRDIVLA